MSDLSIGFNTIVVGTALLLSCSAVNAGTIVQSASGLNCTSNCINGVCTNTCTDQGSTLKGNGDIVVKELDFKGFDAVTAQNIELLLKRADEYSVQVQADSNLLEKVRVEQQGNMLIISLENGSYQNARFKVMLGMPSISALDLNSVQTARVENFNQTALSLALYGVSNLHGDNNKIATLHHIASGVSTLDFSNSQVELAQLDIDGTSSVDLAFSGKGVLAGVMRGVGTVTYCGRPDNQLQTYGIADVKRVDC